MRKSGLKNYMSSCSEHSFLIQIYTRFVTGVEMLVDMASIFCGILGGYLTYSVIFTLQQSWYHCLGTATVMSLLGCLVFERFGLYRKQVSLMNLIEIRKIIRAVGLLFLVLLLYASFFSKDYPPYFILFAALYTLFFALFERMVFFKLQQAVHMRGINVKSVLIIGAGERGKLLCQTLSNAPKLGYMVVGFMDDSLELLETAKDRFRKGRSNDPEFYEDYEELQNLVIESRVDEVFLCNSRFRESNQQLLELAKLCKRSGVKFRFSPHIKGFYNSQVKVDDFGGLPMISIEDIPQSPAELITKRIFDLIFAGIATILSTPLFLIIAHLIRRDSDGHVFFKQTRVGKHGKPFAMYKFRTMYQDAPEYCNSPESSEDPRITKIGRVLRKTSLDELPQLLNVLRGEMSLVGPRPEMPFIVENEYNDLHRERLKVKPGITGVWQISGDRTLQIHENISYDLFYIENRSLLLDIIIIVRTIIFGIIAMKTH